MYGAEQNNAFNAVGDFGKPGIGLSRHLAGIDIAGMRHDQRLDGGGPRRMLLRIEKLRQRTPENVRLGWIECSSYNFV